MRTNALCILTGTLLAISLGTCDSPTHGDDSVRYTIDGDTLQLRHADQLLSVSLLGPSLEVDQNPAAGREKPVDVSGSLSDGQTLLLRFPPIQVVDKGAVEVELKLWWSPAESLLRKAARFRLVDADKEHILHEIVLDRIDRQGERIWTHGRGREGQSELVILDGPQSHPVFLPARFVGIEYPVASTRCEGDEVLLAHRPGLRMQPGVWYPSRCAVYGVAPRGQEVRAFQQYIAAHRPAPTGLHVNYNSWWTSPVPYSEADILHLMSSFRDNLFETHDVPLDTFCIDLGWSNVKSVWEIDAKQFPQGFGPISEAAHSMQANLGLWISPSSYYSGAVDNDWAREQGFESLTVYGHGGTNTTTRLLCLGGSKYGQRFRDALVELVGRWDIHHLKLDGCNLLCSETDHGHEPGLDSSESIAAGVIAAVEAAHQTDPQLWIETTCFGYNPSPWWLFHVNSVIGTFGDDAPVGRVPAPIYRESYTTARDYFNLQGAELLPIPSSALEVLGVVHQTAEPFLNDAVMTVMRGHMFLPLYVNPRHMNDARWKSLAELLRWTRSHADFLSQATPLLPVDWQVGPMPHFSDAGTMPRQPYGYAHAGEDEALIVLRNPWIARQSYELRLDNLLANWTNDRELDAVSLYPEPRVYAQGVKVGQPLNVALAPYETVVLRIAGSQTVADLPVVDSAVGSQLAITRANCSLQQVTFEDSKDVRGPNWTSLLGEAASAVRVTLDADVTVSAPAGELLILCEGEKSPATPIGQVLINGQPVATTPLFSDTGWSATLLPKHEHWTFVRVPLQRGENRITGELYASSDSSTISAWLWATKPGSSSSYPATLPQPEIISLDSAVLIASTKVDSLPVAEHRMPRPVERIDGVYLDRLEPASVSQGWGQLQRNQSVWEKPMVVGGTPFTRGLGTHAPSKLVYALDGKYRRFQSWAGADGNTSPTVTFEVWIDGAKKWETGLITRDSPPQRVDLDITGAKTLELIVGSSGDLGADHADWADAKLLD